MDALTKATLNTRNGWNLRISSQRLVSQMPNKKSLTKIVTKRFYELPSKAIVKVVRVDWSKNTVIVHNYHTHSNEFINYEEAVKILNPVFLISEVSKMVGKKSSTIRKYESSGLIAPARKISLSESGKATTRVYNLRDVEEILEFFEKRRPVGRPSSVNISGFNKNAIREKLTIALKKEKENG